MHLGDGAMGTKIRDLLDGKLGMLVSRAAILDAYLQPEIIVHVQ